MVRNFVAQVGLAQAVAMAETAGITSSEKERARRCLEDLLAGGATLYGVSCDAHYSQTAFKDALHIEIEQLSDFEPKGAVCAAFGVLHPGGFPQRALVLIGADGVVKWSYEAPSPSELPGANLIFDALAAHV